MALGALSSSLAHPPALLSSVVSPLALGGFRGEAPPPLSCLESSEVNLWEGKDKALGVWCLWRVPVMSTPNARRKMPSLGSRASAKAPALASPPPGVEQAAPPPHVKTPTPMLQVHVPPAPVSVPATAFVPSLDAPSASAPASPPGVQQPAAPTLEVHPPAPAFVPSLGAPRGALQPQQAPQARHGSQHEALGAPAVAAPPPGVRQPGATGAVPSPAMAASGSGGGMLKRWWGGGSGGKPVEADTASREKGVGWRGEPSREYTGLMKFMGPTGGRTGSTSNVKKMVGFEPSSLESSMISGFGYAPSLALSQSIWIKLSSPVGSFPLQS